jgi:hypothetical protein
LPPWWQWPVVTSVVWIGLFVALAIWRFGREEF